MATKAKPGPASERDRLINDKNPKYNSSSVGDDDDDDEESGNKEEDKGSILVYAFLLMLFFQLGNRIFGRLQTFPMHNYPLFMNMLSVFIYIPASFAYIWPMQYYTNVITKEQQEIPKYKFCIMGIYDSIAGIMQTFAVNYITNSSTIVLVQQSAIPISMVISKISLQAQYTTAQYVGAGVVLLGIVVVLIPSFLPSAASAASAADASAATGGESQQSELMWIFIMVLSCIPMCLSSVYKEKALGETEIDVVYLNGWVAVFQFLVAIPLCFPSAVAISLPYDEILPNMYNGAKCWLGINTIMEADEANGIWKDNCEMAPFFVNTYLAFNLIFNVLIIVILKHGSANILWMASTVIVPLSNIAFSLDFMPNHKPLTVWDIAGLVVIMAGLILYRFMSQLTTLYYTITCQKVEEEEETELDKVNRKLGKKAESSQAKFLGFNQAEALNTFFDTRVLKARKKSLFRSPQQIRGSYFVKIGVQPSPLVTMSPSSRANAGRTSPAIHPNPMTRTLSLTRKVVTNPISASAATGETPSSTPAIPIGQSNTKSRLNGASSNLSGSINNNSSVVGIANYKQKSSEV